MAGTASLVLAIFMYGFRSKLPLKLRWSIGVLRFLTVFGVLLLLINPKFRSEIISIEKPNLPILLDNSASVPELGQESNLSDVLSQLKTHEQLNEIFDISYYTFGRQVTEGDSLTFAEKNTDISSALATLGEVYKNNIAPVVLISDGNQTLGQDYEFTSPGLNQPIFPVVLGDSTQYTDLQISRLNTNRYAFLKNQFPVEVLLSYSGNENVNSQFTVKQNNTIVYSQSLQFTSEENTKTVLFTLPATSVGLQKYVATISPLPQEKNKTNNSKRFAVEVIDQATNVLIVSKLMHPDLGALKKAITTNEQRTVRLAKPSDIDLDFNDYQLVILYQPEGSFGSIFSELEKRRSNLWIVTGTETDWTFLSRAQPWFKKETTRQTEEVQAQLNNNFNSFSVVSLGFNELPPLTTTFGELLIGAPHEIILEQTVSRFTTGSALVATTDIDERRTAIWDGEGIWKWRAASFLNTDSFQDFDAFIGQLVQYLSSKKQRSRLEVANESFYYNNNAVTVSAQYFDKNFEFDSGASVQITITNEETNKKTVFPLLLKNNFYEVDLNSLPAGEYRFTVSVADEGISRSGNFSILEYNVEQQFLNADIEKLRRTAERTKGELFFPAEIDALISTLLDDERFVSIQKSEVKVVPLIDWKYLLAFIVLTLSLEWFMRKYNGLI